MQTSRSRAFLLAAVAGAAAVLMPTVAGGQAGLSPVPGKQAVRPSPRPAADCNGAVVGLVFERVGNLLNGPSRPSGLRNIQMQLLDADDRRVAETRTSRTGRYSFDGVCPGTYTVCPGTPCPTRGPVPSRYEPSETLVTVPPVMHKGVDFRLTEPPPVRQPPM